MIGVDDKLSGYLRNGNIIEAWECLLKRSKNPITAQDDWIDYVAGRFSDRVNGHAPFILWDFIDPNRAEQRTDYARLLSPRLQGDIRQLVAIAETLPCQGAAYLLRGAAAVVSAVLNLSADQKSPAEWLYEAALQYARFWSGIGKGEIAALDKSTSKNKELLELAMEELARPVTSGSKVMLKEDHQRIGWQMVCRALCWSASSASPKADHMTLVFRWESEINNGPPQGVHAELVIEQLPHDSSLGSVFSPDPVALGIVPLDSTWRDSFDHAAGWVKQVTNDCRPAGFRNCTWKLEYSKNEGSQRYLALQHPSASAAAAMVLRALNTPHKSIDQQYVITAAVVKSNNEEYSFAEVGGKAAKVWQYRMKQKSVFVTYGEAKELIDGQGIDFYRGEPAFYDATNRLRIRHETVSSLEEAFELVTGGTQLLRDFLAEQRRQMASRIRRLLPHRLVEANAAGKGNLDEILKLHVEPQAIPKRDLNELRQKQKKDRDARDNLVRGTSESLPEAERYRPPVLGLDDDESIRKLARPVAAMIDDWLEVGNAREHSAEQNGHRLSLAEEPKQTITRWSQDNQKIKILVGGVGTGKTWNTIRTAHRLAKLVEESGGDLQHWLPIWITANELAEFLVANRGRPRTNPEVILDIVHSRLRDGTTDHRKQDYDLSKVSSHLQGWWTRNRILLIIDSWDEASSTASLRKFFDSYCAHRPVIVSTRPERYDNKTEVSHGWELAALEAPLPDLREFIEHWFKDDTARNQALLAQVERNAPLSQMMRMPLLAALMCILAEDSEANHLNGLPYQRFELLKGVLYNLILRASREGKVDGTKLERTDLREWIPFITESLSEVAYETFDGERWRLSEKDLLQISATIADSPVFKEVETSKKSIVSILTGRLGLFTKTDDGQWEILHQYFAEYLVAKYLAEQVANKLTLVEWESYLSSHVSFRILDQRWKEVWRLAGGIMDAPHRSVLLDWTNSLVRVEMSFSAITDVLPAAISAEGLLNSLQSLFIAIVAEGQDVDRLMELRIAANYHETNREATATALREIDPFKTVRRLVELLESSSEEVIIREVTEALGRIGPAAVEGVPALIQLLENSSEVVIREAAKALGRIGPAAVEGVPALIQLLESSSEEVVIREAAEALGRIGVADSVHALIRLLENAPEEIIKSHAACALGNISAPESVTALIQLLDSAWDMHMKGWASDALGMLGPAAADGIPNLIELLRNALEETTKRDAAYVLGQIGPAAAESVPVLIQLLEGAFSETTKLQVAVALSQIDSDKGVPTLIHLLESASEHTTKSLVAKALGELGPPAAIGVPALIKVLQSTSMETTKRWAADALGRIGPAASDGVPAIIQLLEGASEENTKSTAADALGRIGPAAAHGVHALIQLLENASEYFTIPRAAATLGQIGSAAAEGVPALIRLLEYNFTAETKCRAAEALGKIGAVSSVPALIRCLKTDSEEKTKGAAAFALSHIGSVAADGVPTMIGLLHDLTDKYVIRTFATVLNGQISRWLDHGGIVSQDIEYCLRLLLWPPVDPINLQSERERSAAARLLMAQILRVSSPLWLKGDNDQAYCLRFCNCPASTPVDDAFEIVWFAPLVD